MSNHLYVNIGTSKMTIDPSPASGFSRVLQGQELSTLRGTFAESNESEASDKPLLWNSSLDDEKIDVVSASKKYVSEKWLPIGRPESSFTDLLSGFGSQHNASRGFCMPSGDEAVSKRQTQDHESKFSFIGSNWSMLSSGLSLNLMDSSLKTTGQGTDTFYQTRGDVRYGALREFSLMPDYRGDNQQTNWLMPPPISPYLKMGPAQSRELMPKSVFAQPHDAVKPNEGNCKLFGIPLRSNFASSEPTMSNKTAMIEQSSHMQHGLHSHQSSPATESDQRSEQSKGSKVVDNPVATSEHDKQFQTVHPVARERESKGHSGSTRSCTKVLNCI